MAFRQGWRAGADGAELDVRLTADGEVLVCHDASARRTTGRDLIVARETAAALRAADATSWKGLVHPREPMPLLGEVAAELPYARELLVELKCGAEIVPALQSLQLPPATVGFLCFDAEILAAAKRAMPRHRCLLNVEAPRSGRHDPASLLRTCRERNFAGVSLGWHAGLGRALVGALHAAGLQVAVWTVDDPAVAAKAQAISVDLLMTNDPSLLRNALRHG
jgi:glycerophosphoryl diester phosphodiesterase